MNAETGGICLGSYDTSVDDVTLCTEIAGSLTVHNDLQDALKLRMLEGSLIVQSNRVRSLRGLEHLMTIGGDLVVLFTQLPDFSGLDR